jgi:uncharacterized protein YbaR (Trm112 family)
MKISLGSLRRLISESLGIKPLMEMWCAKCKHENNPHAEPNRPDGSFVCRRCRQMFGIKEEPPAALVQGNLTAEVHYGKYGANIYFSDGRTFRDGELTEKFMKYDPSIDEEWAFFNQHVCIEAMRAAGVTEVHDSEMEYDDDDGNAKKFISLEKYAAGLSGSPLTPVSQKLLQRSKREIAEYINSLPKEQS